jgi:hypothetical protein
MRGRTLNSFVKPALLILCAVGLSLTAYRPIQANAPEKTGVTVLTSKGSGNFLNAKGLKRGLLRVITRKAGTNPKVKKVMAGCTCALGPDDWGGTGCFSSCLASWGISFGSLVTCGGTCAIAATGNPIGIVVCAACLGTAEWIVAGCALHCISSRWGLLESSTKKPKLRGTQQARLTLKRAPTRS